MKKHLMEIILIILGIILISIDPKNLFIQGICAGIFVVAIIVFFIHRSTQKDSRQYPVSKRSPNDDRRAFPISSQSVENQSQVNPITNQSSSNTTTDYKKAKEEQRIARLKQVIEQLKPIILDRIWGIEDIGFVSSVYLTDDDLEYIAKELPVSALFTTVWDFHQKTINKLLTDDEILKILELGTHTAVDNFITNYSDNTSWTMSASLFEKIIAKNPLFLFRFQNYNKSTLAAIIDRLSAYELLGFRMKPNSADETFYSSFVDLQKSTEDNEIEISYYESSDTDMVYFLEQNYPEEKSLRQIAFDKIIAGSVNVVDMISRLDEIRKNEFEQIFARNYSAEIDAIFEKTDADDFVDYLPLNYAVSALLEIIPCDFDDTIKDNYDFENASKDDYYKLIEQLTADELLGYSDCGEGSYDFISLLEDQNIEDKKLRNTAFDKMFNSDYLVDGIENWNDVTEYEINQIMESQKDPFIEALFDRDDTGDIIEKLSDEFIIKARLGLFDFVDIDDINSEYDDRIANEKFKSKVEKLVSNLK
ncbi:MAG: hypothetical protein WCL18_11070 [bacterium]